MKRVMLPALAILAIINAGCGQMKTDKDTQARAHRGYEMPCYDVLVKTGNIEIRRYRPALMAEVLVPGEREVAINQGFRILAAYIFGDNATKGKIAMTTPVVQSGQQEKIPMTTPVVQTGDALSWKVQFMMPSQYSMESLPLPKDQRIKFKINPPEQRVVIRFSGFSSGENLKRHLNELESHLLKNSLKVKGSPQYYFYDPPWTLPFLRRNEIAYALS